MSQIAEQTGIERATLYKYFSDVEAVLLAWHERQVAEHLHHLAEVRDHAGTAQERLEAVLKAYAAIAQQCHVGELATLLHQGEHITHAERHLAHMVETLVAEGAAAGDLRGDVPPAELAQYCLHALTAAGPASKAAVNRLVDVTLRGLRPVH
ncbi:TetR/AcrR family transcriptional regulator [Streptomyces sp. NPDC059866]|uniref:TetR/AcrR family transcriptional regulator n=1 Tax=Streptomyces sp. NPDC059866 TaxID=3346978 RepID=UPI0036582FAE